MICRKLSYTWKGCFINPRSRASGSVSSCVYVCGCVFWVCVRGNEQMAQCAMSCYVIIMEHAWGKLGEGKRKKKKVLMRGQSVCSCVNEARSDGDVLCMWVGVAGCCQLRGGRGSGPMWKRNHHDHRTSTTS